MINLSDIFEDFDATVKGDVKALCDKPTLIMATTARTGSTQLCSVIESMLAFGSLDEIFNTRGVVQKNIEKYKAQSFVEYIEKHTKNSAPCFSFKTSWGDFEPISLVWQKIFPRARFVFLDRFDIMAQAFSLYKAIETGQWHRGSHSNIQNHEMLVRRIDSKHLQSLMNKLIVEKYNWEKFFYTNKQTVKRLHYEIIKNDWISAAKFIAEDFGFQGLDANAGAFVRVSDESDDHLIEIFKKNHGYSWLSV